jgi:hypothetical protein
MLRYALLMLLCLTGATRAATFEFFLNGSGWSCPPSESSTGGLPCSEPEGHAVTWAGLLTIDLNLFSPPAGHYTGMNVQSVVLNSTIFPDPDTTATPVFSIDGLGGPGVSPPCNCAIFADSPIVVIDNAGNVFALGVTVAYLSGVPPGSFLQILFPDLSTFHATGSSVDGTVDATATLTPVPEPASYGLMLAGLGVVAVTATRRRRNHP